MASRKRKILGGLITVVALGVALPVIFTPTEACACITPAMEFRHAFGVDAIESTAPQVRAAVEARFPVGTPIRELDEARRTMGDTGDGDGACEATEASLRCQLELESSAFDFYLSEIDVEFLLDKDDRVAGHRVVKRRWLLGFQL
jgi:hypothetical protein